MGGKRAGKELRRDGTERFYLLITRGDLLNFSVHFGSLCGVLLSESCCIAVLDIFKLYDRAWIRSRINTTTVVADLQHWGIINSLRWPVQKCPRRVFVSPSDDWSNLPRKSSAISLQRPNRDDYSTQQLTIFFDAEQYGYSAMSASVNGEPLEWKR